MPMPGFDKDYYLEEKLQSLQNNPATAVVWADRTRSDLVDAVQAAGMTPLSHYEQFGYSEFQYESNGNSTGRLTPNAFFDAEAYITAKASQLIEDGEAVFGVDFDALTQTQAEDQFVEIWKDVGSGNVYDHYIEYGRDEGISPAQTMPESQSPTTYVGAEHGSYPYSAVTYIEAAFPSGKTYTGSGAVVGENDVLTASHVIYSPADGGLAESITVYPGLDGTDQRYGSYEAVLADYYEVDNDGDGLFYRNGSEDDLAVLGFDTDFGNQTGWFGMDAGVSSGDYNLTGYPGVYATDQGPRMTNDKGTVTENNFYSVFDYDSIESSVGNSGGPLWYHNNGEVYIVGVASTADWATNVASRYSDILDAIDGNNHLYESSRAVASAEVGDGVGPVEDIVMVGVDTALG